MQVLCCMFRKLKHAGTCHFWCCSKIGEQGNGTYLRAISGAVQKLVSKAIHEKPWHVDGLETSEWILMDFVDIVVHIFQKQTRSHYDIESLWGDAKQTLIESKY